MVGPQGNKRPLFSGETILNKREKARPTYETDTHRKHEREAAQAIAKRIGCNLIKTPRKYCVDYTVTKKKHVVGFIEIKFKNMPISESNPLKISMHKVLEILKIASTTGLKCKIHFVLVDAKIDVEITEESVREMGVEVWGRHDRGDWQDTEPCMTIPAKLWKRVA